jgi:hypothetical protein
MKIAAQRGFWSLRPTLTAGHLEFGCWVAAGLLAVALAISPAAPAEPSALRPGTMGVLQGPDLLAYRQHCIDRVLSSDLGMTEDYAVRQINRQCSKRSRTAAPPVVPTCLRVFKGQVTPLGRRAPGCASV